MNPVDRYYNPYRIGYRLYKNGYGISDLVGAVKQDSDLEEAMRGYTDARKEDKEIRSKLGYSRIGLNNV
jgi:hypothetical protein